MSIQAVAWALEQDLPARPKLVLVSIANHANHIDGYCWLKAETIAGEAACTPRSVYNFIGMLVRNGYIRKAPKRGEDGKQRANDYWILFNREPREWDAAADAEPVDSVDAEGDDAISSVPDEGISCGENDPPDERGDTRRAVEKHAGSVGPCEAAFSHKRIAEPSESNPKASGAGARVHPSTLRNYRPPPPQPVAADTEHKKQPIFVYENSRAYKDWAVVEARKAGLRSWHLTTRAFIDGTWRTGWYFPTLFPPAEKPQGPADQGKTGPPAPAA